MRKIEENCRAIVRATGMPVAVVQKYPGYRGLPTMWACSNGIEYLSGELRLVELAEFGKANRERV